MTKSMAWASALLGYSWRKTAAFVRSLTLEPVIFLYIFGPAIVYGTALTQNMLIQKMCRVKLGFSEEGGRSLQYLNRSSCWD